MTVRPAQRPPQLSSSVTFIPQDSSGLSPHLTFSELFSSQKQARASVRSSQNSLHFFGALSTDDFKQFAAQSGVSCLSPQADCHPALRLLAIPGPRALMGIGRNPWEVRAGEASLGDDRALQCPEDIPLRNCLLSITWVPSSTPRAGDTGMSCGGDATEGPAVQHRRPCPSQHGRADAAQRHSGEGDQPWGGDGGRAGLTCWRPGHTAEGFPFWKPAPSMPSGV